MPEKRDMDERISLHGLDPEESLKAFMEVDPDEEVDTDSTDESDTDE